MFVDDDYKIWIATCMHIYKVYTTTQDDVQKHAYLMQI